MRVIAYVNPIEDAHALRSRLLEAGASKVSCRSGNLWRDRETESGFDKCHAPDYPAIRAAYSALGIPDLDGNFTAKPELEELRSVPQCDCATIVCPGIFALSELNERKPKGAIIAVNEAALFLNAYDYVICNDGFIDNTSKLVTSAVRVTRACKRNTLPSCRWFDLEYIGIFNALSTNLCAIRFAVSAIKAKRLLLIGNDFVPGRGIGTTDWPQCMADRVMNETVTLLRELAAKGVSSEHVRWDGKKTYTENYHPGMTS